MADEPKPSLTKRIVTGAKKRIVPDWRSRIRDYSSLLAQIGVAVQGLMMTLPVGTVSLNMQAWIATAFFVLIQVAKIITEPRNTK